MNFALDFIFVNWNQLCRKVVFPSEFSVSNFNNWKLILGCYQRPTFICNIWVHKNEKLFAIFWLESTLLDHYKKGIKWKLFVWPTQNAKKYKKSYCQQKKSFYCFRPNIAFSTFYFYNLLFFFLIFASD